ncbi:MAG: glutamate--tRNA ligase, partial [Nitrosopumilaceae archaeon]
MDDDIKNEIRKVALQNAYEHEGKTQDKIVLSKILGTKPEFRSKVKEIIGDISHIGSSVNQLSFDEQKNEIEENFPGILKPK